MRDRAERGRERLRGAALAGLLGASVLVAGCASTASRVKTTPSEAASTPSASGTAQDPAAGAVELAARAREAAEAQACTAADPSKRASEEYESGRRAVEAAADAAALAPATSEAAEPEAGAEEPLEPSPLDELPESSPVSSPSELDRERSLLPSPGEFDIPIVVNDQVLSWVSFFTGPHREKFQASLERSGMYLDMIRKTFEEAGIPKDLAYMAHVESAFKVTAYSRAQAKGLFQFISDTGRRYGLRVDRWVDERSDPEKATRAAAAYLRDLYQMFGDWYLALAAYNTGEGNVQRSMNRTGKKDYWDLVGKRALHRETRGYVPAILAATIVAKEPSRYGFEYAPLTPPASDVVDVPGGVHLKAIASVSGTDYETLKALNLELRRQRTPPGGGWKLRVPPGTGGAVAEALRNVSPRQLDVAASHTVRKGETLASVASHYGVSVAALRSANGISKKSRLGVGQTLVVPYDDGAAGGDREERRRRTADGPAMTYRVRKGDTLDAIARDFRSSASAIANANGIGVGSTLKVGQSLKIPTARPVTSTAVASAKTAHAAKSAKAPASSKAGPEKVVHTVRAGESLTRIATKYRVTVDEICALNHIQPDSTLYPGTRLTIRSN